jgi:hypothetical protein
MEELRDLSMEEWNFKAILEDKLLDLLHQQKIYWKQRGTIKWVKFGDEGTKFFHANTTIRHRRNLITTLVDANDQEVQERHLKATILWEAFKDRLGISEPCSLDSEIFQLLQQHPNLSILEDPFSHEEIDQVVLALPSDKSPGPDGFNTDFVKKMLANNYGGLLSSLSCVPCWFSMFAEYQWIPYYSNPQS